jgi:hypothetical protein
LGHRPAAYPVQRQRVRAAGRNPPRTLRRRNTASGTARRGGCRVGTADDRHFRGP